MNNEKQFNFVLLGNLNVELTEQWGRLAICCWATRPNGDVVEQTLRYGNPKRAKKAFKRFDRQQAKQVIETLANLHFTV